MVLVSTIKGGLQHIQVKSSGKIEGPMYTGIVLCMVIVFVPFGYGGRRGFLEHNKLLDTIAKHV